MLQVIVLIHFFGNSQVYSFTNNFTIIYNRDSSSYHVRFMLLLVLIHLWTEWYEIGLLFYEPLDGVVLVSQSWGKIKILLKWLSSFCRFISLLATLTCFFKASLLIIFCGEIYCFLHSTNFALVFPEVSISLYQFHEEVLKNAAQNFFSLIRSKGVTVVSQLVGYKIWWI